jgi:hypothetical protein
MKRIFVAQVVPQKYVTEFKVSQAGNNFCNRLISFNLFSEVFSIPPVNITKKLKCGNLPYRFVQIRLVPHLGLFKICNVLFENIQLFCIISKSTNKGDKIWFYNLTISNVLAFVLLKCKRRDLFVIVADYEPNFNLFSFKWFLSFLLGKAQGMIALSHNLRSVFKKNTGVINGVNVDLLSAFSNKVSQSVGLAEKAFLYSGALEDYCGIGLALNVFSQYPDAQLFITGRGTKIDKVLEFSRRSNNIHYIGFLSYLQYMDMLQKVTFCLSLRDPGVPFNHYNFPSKIIEFCQLEKIVITTMKYHSFPDSILKYCRFDEGHFLDTVKECLKMDKATIGDLGRKAREKVTFTFGKESWQEELIQIEQKSKVVQSSRARWGM